ncbi:MAG: hypothetical protein A3A04_01915 [Candidatus Harrisonbacteria bacterium RIFCSPLOWO2_01_FULL_40_28]|uniref:NodB homology domain-containing protein n=1 Tax=Candidatus Harrisonbacteria bacterium RIFCSPLOWO2_01_FULL_40_28 TaxID=1798406 RepID=A0A1G1ZJP4_9BACT|nr:MAG: hypothetical protein A3A04_01915 [Candidatus Harrisonbacteria bacterium RIFCSPLOWO2_01_FULL_40_28]
MHIKGFLLLIGIGLILGHTSIHSASAHEEGPNLVKNPSLELSTTGSAPDEWLKGRWGVNKAFFTYPVLGHSSSRGARVEISEYTSGDAKWYFKEVPVTPGKIYVFRDTWNATIGSFVTIQFKMTNGGFIYKDIAQLGPSTSWQRTEKEFVVPQGVQSLTVFHLIKNVGILNVDNYELREEFPETQTQEEDPLNLVKNPSLELSTTGSAPDEWLKGRWGVNKAFFTYPVLGHSSSRGARVEISEYTSGDAKWYFKEVPVTPGKIYVLANDYTANTQSYVTVQLRSSNNTYSYVDIAILPPSSAWTHVEKTITIPQDIVGITVFHLINRIGILNVDNYVLRIKETQGGVITTTSTDRFNEGLVTLHFDDGWKSIYDNAIPILNKAGIKSTQYIVSHRLTGFSGYVNKEEVLDMQAKGHEIGSHTETHQHLTALSEDDMRKEILDSRDDLLLIGASPVRTFAYPFGDYNSNTDSIIRNSRYYTSARTSNAGFNTKTTDKFLLERQPVTVNTSASQIKSWIDTSLYDKLWLILTFHNVDYTGSQYSTTPEVIQEVTDYLTTKKAKVVTTTEAIALMLQ